MVFHYSYGELGNQVFQYMFLKTVTRPGETIVTSNFTELRKLFLLPDTFIFFKHRYFRFLAPFLKMAARLRIVTAYRSNRITAAGVNFETDTFRCTKGLLPVTVVFPGYFQSEKFFNPEIAAGLQLRNEHLRDAREFLRDIPANYHKVFVHVRRGDYLTCNFHGLGDATIPLSYYVDRLTWFREHVSDPFFIFLSNDPQFIQTSFGDVEPSKVSGNSMYVDLAIMTLCDSAIIPNSSFSWWGAYLMKNRQHVFAPRYWLGYKKKTEIPAGIFPGFATEA